MKKILVLVLAFVFCGLAFGDDKQGTTLDKQDVYKRYASKPTLHTRPPVVSIRVNHFVVRNNYYVNRIYYDSYTAYRTIYLNYHLRYGIAFQNGYYYFGRAHYHWSYVYWATSYSCYVYYDPWTSAYYYWNKPDNCYYPFSFNPYGTYSWEEETK